MTTEILINRYKVLERLGEGAMGAVWLVEDSTSQQLLAMKVLSQQMGDSDKSFLQLKQEFRLMTQLRHPNCCAVYDYGQLPEGAPYLTMELVPGQGLDEMLPVRGEQFRGILSQLLLALGYIHQLGYVHSDIKGANVRVKPDGQVKLMDYGLMELAGRSGAPIKGTLAYLAPEVVKRGPIDQRADLYALGCMAYEMLAGQPPFMSRNPMDVLRAHVTDAPPPLGQFVKVDAQTERIVLKLLAKDPLDRYQSAYEVLADMGVEVPAGIGGNLLTSPMIGRDEELAGLGEHLKEIAKWQPGAALLVTGPAGIGKSRLLEEFRYLVQIEDLVYAVGTLAEQSATPYGPVAEILRKLLPVLRELVPANLEAAAPVLVKLLPELAVPPAQDLDPPVREKLRLQATITDLLVQLSQKRGLVMALEDWHWADPLSGELLEYMLRNTKENPILFLVTARAVPEAIAAWGERVSHMVLKGLEPRALWRMVTSMLGSDAVGTRLMQQIAEFSEGNPFLVERLLEHLVRERYLQTEKGRWNTQIELTPEQLPADVGSMLMSKLDQVSAEAQVLARAAAVVAHGLTLDLLQAVTAFSDDVLFDAIAALQLAGVFEQDEHGTYRFAQEQLIDLLYATLPMTEKARLHAAVLEALEPRIAGRELAEVGFEDVRALAYHALKGNLTDKTIVYALEAGLRSLALNALADAEQFLSDGLALVRLEAGGRWKPYLLDYLRCLADTYRTASKHAPAKELLAEAIPLAEELEKNVLLGRMLTSLAKSHQVLTEYADALTHAGRSVEVSEASGDLAGLARALMTMGRVHFFKGSLADALVYTERAIAAGRESGDTTILGFAYGMGGYFYVASGQPDKLDEGVRFLNESLALLEATGDRMGLINSLVFLGNAQVMLGDYPDAWKSFLRVRNMAFETGSKDDEIVALVNLATTALELGDCPEAMLRAKEARDLVDKRGSSKYAKGLAVVAEALAMVYAGQPAKSRGMAQDAIDLVREIKNKYVEALTLPYQMDVLLQLGLLEEAKAAGEALQALIKETGNTEPEGRMNAIMAEILGREGNLAGARSFAERALEGAIAAQSKGLQARAHRVLAWLDMQAEAWPQAITRAEEALALAERIGARTQVQELAGLLGELTLASGGAARVAAAYFETQEAVASEREVGLFLASARFGRAAAAPCRREARELAAAAVESLRGLTDAMTPEAAASFLAIPERARVLGGDYHGFSLPRRLADRAAALWLKIRTFYRLA
ncbi:MAG: hypothetical protein JWM80_2767 [Cyanobacteria bacterium RYN_339]|nr:hypothetical protein [Cyanobacteria bacterium RYN_339]